jgi:hypothetical protein
VRSCLAILLIGTLSVVAPVCSHADTETVPGWVIGAGLLLVVTDFGTLAWNTDAIADGRGSVGGGWMGILVGGTTLALGVTATSDGGNSTGPAILAAGGFIVGAVGVWSLEVAGSQPDTPATRSLSLGPALARRIDGAPEARLGLALTF